MRKTNCISSKSSLCKYWPVGFVLHKINFILTGANRCVSIYRIAIRVDWSLFLALLLFFRVLFFLNVYIFKSRDSNKNLHIFRQCLMYMGQQTDTNTANFQKNGNTFVNHSLVLEHSAKTKILLLLSSRPRLFGFFLLIDLFHLSIYSLFFGIIDIAFSKFSVFVVFLLLLPFDRSLS